jgi:SWI/SNF-related matrix-associated actin-dependent regulator 1 of chromatin subfamily A
MLYDYQREGAKYLASRKVALLADEMGVGKSAQVVAACDLINAKRVLVVCPAVARIHWIREFAKFSTQTRPFEILFTAKQPLSPGLSVITSYDLTFRTKITGAFDVLVLDEVHFLKSLETRRSKAVFGKEGLVRQAKRVWAVSGTPAPNHAGELWIMLYTFGVTKLNYTAFVERYCTYYVGPYGLQITGTKMQTIPELKLLLGKIMLRRKKEDVMLQLPPIYFQDMVVQPGEINLESDSGFFAYVYPHDRTQFLNNIIARERKLVEDVMETTRAGPYGLKALESISRSVSALRRYTGMQKIKPVAELILAELKANAYDKVVIFAIHQAVIEGLRVELRKFNPVTLYGRTEASKRQRNIDKFQKNPRCRVFIGNVQAAGTAITLTASNQVVVVECPWTPGDLAQAVMRCHRMGQKKTVTVRVIGLADSIDEKISRLIKQKARQLSRLFDERVLPSGETADIQI